MLQRRVGHSMNSSSDNDFAVVWVQVLYCKLHCAGAAAEHYLGIGIWDDSLWQ